MALSRTVIWSDYPVDAEGAELLRSALGDDELISASAASSSVLAAAGRDESFAKATIAFGQPNPDDVLHAPGLKWLQISSAGYTRYDTPEFREAVRKSGLIVTNSSGVYDIPCADQVFSFMLAQSRNLVAGLASPTTTPGTGEWHMLRAGCVNLRGSTVLLLGYGAIGKQLVKLLAPFECRIIGVRRTPRGDEGIETISLAQLASVVGEADHVVNILPDNSESVRFMDATFFARLKPGAILYNIGRGTTVDQDALVDALVSQQLGAAWLDVTDPEPLPSNHPLLALPNCHITPHIGGGHRGEGLSRVRHFIENLERYRSGREMIDRIFR